VNLTPWPLPKTKREGESIQSETHPPNPIPLPGKGAPGSGSDRAGGAACLGRVEAGGTGSAPILGYSNGGREAAVFVLCAEVR